MNPHLSRLHLKTAKQWPEYSFRYILQAVGITPPSPFYVEECESCLELLFDVGLHKYLQSWFSSNTQPQVETHPEYLTKYGKKMRDNICK